MTTTTLQTLICKKNDHAFDDDDNVDHENFEKHMANTSKTEQGSCQVIKVLSRSEQEPKKMDDLMAALHSSSIKFAKSLDRGRILNLDCLFNCRARGGSAGEISNKPLLPHGCERGR